MTFQNFEEALQICLSAPNGSKEQDEALVYCLEHAPEELKELLKNKFVEFHLGGKPGGSDSCGCCSGEKKRPGAADFLK